jgi:aspartyl-tRNA(Asn)/glutamyl-tRNA(Gln) amidotransferase subunit A
MSEERNTVSLSARQIGRGYRSGETDPVEVTKAYLSRIKSLNPRLNCFITVLADSALKSAEESRLRFKRGSPLGDLDGVPVAIKDIIYIQGVRCTAGSKILENNVAPYDAPVVSKLKAAGAILLGTTNLHEFAAGTTSVNPHYGAVKNPWNDGRVAGGSSGGSAAAVASGMAPVAIGTDTAGSVRIPAALCGVLGLKPTYGLVSRLGVIPLSTSLDTVGILANRCWDAAALLRAISGSEPGDLTTAGGGAVDLGTLSRPLGNPKVGVVEDYFLDGVDPAVRSNFSAFTGRLRDLGCQIATVKLDGISEIYDRWVPIRRAEATAFHLKWLETVPELYGDDVRRLLELGKGVLAVDYVNAINARPSYMERFSASMEGFDALAVPCTSIPAPPRGQDKVAIDGKEVPVYSALNRLTLPFNYVGFPALSVPSGLAEGLPLGVQLVGKLFDEVGVLRLAEAYESKFGPFPSPPL